MNAEGSEGRGQESGINGADACVGVESQGNGNDFLHESRHQNDQKLEGSSNRNSAGQGSDRETISCARLIYGRPILLETISCALGSANLTGNDFLRTDYPAAPDHHGGA